MMRYLRRIRETGKIKHLTQSQIRAIQSRLSRCLNAIRKYLKLGTVATSLCVISTSDIDAQCRMNRLPISTQSSFLPNVLSPYVPAFVDYDRDGDYDLVIGFYYGKSVYENQGGVFKRAQGLLDPFVYGSAGLYVAPTFVDIDNDGDQDAFFGHTDGSGPGSIRFFRNENGSFERITGSGNPVFGINVEQHSRPAFVDIDADGDPDLFAGSKSGGIKFFRNVNGTFTEVTGSGNPLQNVLVGSNTKLEFLDIDEDGDPDVFIGDEAGKINFFRNVNGTFVEILGASNPFNGVDVGHWATPTFADVDGDGDMDAYVGSRYNPVVFFKNEDGSFVPDPVNEDITGGLSFGSANAPTFADLDGDGDEDLFSGTSNGEIRAFFNNNGLFIEVTGTNNPFDGIDVGNDAKPVLIDIDPTDEDTEFDLVVGNREGKVLYFRNINNSYGLLGGLSDPFQGADIGDNAAPTFVDFDGDNDKDAFVGDRDGKIHYFRNDNGAFNEITGSGNPFNGIDVGKHATPNFFRFSNSKALVGEEFGRIIEFEKVANQYVRVTDSSFDGVRFGDNVAPVIVDISPDFTGAEVVVGIRSPRGIYVFSDQGGRSNVWQGSVINDWHDSVTNWELQSIPETECDNVHVLRNAILVVDQSFIGEARTLNVKDGGQFEVKSGAELLIEP